MTPAIIETIKKLKRSLLLIEEKSRIAMGYASKIIKRCDPLNYTEGKQ